ncbi:oxygen-independent coproporphyrinogen III oxidase [Marinicellulosiphila megalodicopiae]|uniref:oxygen-independent coproporphyrinogen III oxidase n=1 Tax=Marinicellulosiphila megalodicopiae TaxID=2724896 RepID=UPI003BAFD53C
MYNNQQIKTLVTQYNVSGPRYTSYPTALQFDPITQNNIQRVLNLQIGRTEPLSLYIHIPFCEHICFYCACNKVATKDHTKADHYLDKLEKEMQIYSTTFGHRVIEQLHLGGGTPTFLTPNQLTRLLNLIKQYFNMSDQGEYSIELDPRATSDEHLLVLKKFGFNRASIGVQDFSVLTQQAINRIQPESMVKSLLNQLRKLDFSSINFDLIYGLPKQTTQRFLNTIDKVIDLNPDRIAVYNYAHLPERFKPQRRIDTNQLPSVGEKLEMMSQSIVKLENAGYRYIGMDHFAKPEDELVQAQQNGTLQRNFQGYATCGNLDLLALGCSSISKMGPFYWQNHSDLALYEQSVDDGLFPINKGVSLSDDDLVRQKVINLLSCAQTVNFHEINVKFNIDFKQYFKSELNSLDDLIRSGLIKVDDESIEVTNIGKLMIRPICMKFDAYLNNIIPSFSKVL